MPDAMPFAIATMSGFTPVNSIANIFPVRPIPDCTSSSTSRMPLLLRHLAQPLQELIRRDDVPAFALNRLDDDRSHFVGRDEVNEQLILEIVEAFGGAVIRRETERTAVAIGVRRVIHAGHQRPEAAPLDRLARGERQRAHRAAVEAAEERDNVLPARGISRQLQARFDRLGAGVAEKRSRAALGRRRRSPAPRRAAPAARSRSRCPTCAGTSAPDR